MSEYIYETQGEQVIGNPKGFILPKEEIVRCGDCKHMIHFWHHDDERWQCTNEMLEGLDVSPDFFCAWGERMVDAE